MSCRIPRPTLAALFAQASARFSIDVLKGSEIIPETNEWYVVGLHTAMMDEFFSIADQLAKDLDPTQCCCESLYEIAARDGIYPRGATGASGYVTFTGTAGAKLPTQLGVVLGDEALFTTSKLPFEVPASGTVTARVRSQSTGSKMNQSTGADQTLALTTTYTGLSSTATLHGGLLCGGTDAEECEPFRERYHERLRMKPRSRAADIETLILSWPCATRVARRGGSCCKIEEDASCASLCTNGLNYYVFFDGTFENGLAPQCTIDEMNTWLFGTTPGAGEGQADIGVCGSLHTATAVPVAVMIAGLDCYGRTKKTMVEERIAALFKTMDPSSFLLQRAVEAVIVQIYGASVDFELTMTPESTAHCTVYPCGDIEFDCDYVPTLQCVTFAATDGGGC